MVALMTIQQAIYSNNIVTWLLLPSNFETQVTQVGSRF